jgi:fructose-1,6-bisphosphatase/inositol monophosphatase family enzyme
MKIEELIKIGIEIRSKIEAYIKENPDEYAKEVEVDQLPPNIRVKDPTNIIHQMDLEAEYALNDALKKRKLSAKIISEEFEPRIVGNHADFLLIFDPIDGSTNAACGIPFYCTSLAYTEKIESATFDDISMAVVCDKQGNIYHAEMGKGAFFNNIRITKIESTKCTKSEILSVFSYGVEEVPNGLLELFKKKKARTFGSIALEMCLVARGTLDGVIDTRKRLSGYDITASALILKESGGFLTDLRGENVSNNVQDTDLSIVGTKNKKLQDEIVEKLGEKR